MAADIQDWTDAVTVTGGSVSISGTASVSIAGTPTVAITGTPTVNVGNTPSVVITSGSVIANLIGTPTVNISSGSQILIQTPPNVVPTSPSGAYLGDLSTSSQGADAWTDSITTVGGPIVQGLAAIASFKAASAISLVGALGAVATGTNVAVTPAFGQATTAGHLLVAWVSADAAGIGTAAAGWVEVAVTSSLFQVSIWIKPNSGAGEAAPTFTCGAGGRPMVAQLAEFAGPLAAGPTDQVGGGPTASASISVANAAPDAASGELVIGVSRWLLTSAASATFSDSFNNQATAKEAGNTGGASLIYQAHHAYAITPTRSSFPLGVAPWAYDASAVHAPATGSQATVTLAASPTKAWVAHTLIASSLQTTAVTSQPLVSLLDGATVIASFYLGNPATVGSQQSAFITGLAYRGSVNTAMVAHFSSGLAGDAQAINLGAYLRP